MDVASCVAVLAFSEILKALKGPKGRYKLQLVAVLQGSLGNFYLHHRASHKKGSPLPREKAHESKTVPSRGFHFVPRGFGRTELRSSLLGALANDTASIC